MAISFISLILIALVGAGVLVANPRAQKNQAYALLAGLGTIWMLVYADLVNYESDNKVELIRLIVIIGATMAPAGLWAIKCIQKDKGNYTLLWCVLVFTAILSYVVTTQYFIPDSSTREHKVTGRAYVPCLVGEIVEFITLAFVAGRAWKRSVGLVRLELLAMVYGALCGGVGIMLLSAAQRVMESPVIDQVRPAVVTTFFLMTAWLIISRKIMSPGEVYERLLRWVISAIVAVLAYEAIVRLAIGNAVVVVFAVSGIAAAFNELISRHDWASRALRLRLQNANDRLRQISEEAIERRAAARDIAKALVQWSGAKAAFVIVRGKSGEFSGFDHEGEPTSLPQHITKYILPYGSPCRRLSSKGGSTRPVCDRTAALVPSPAGNTG